MNEAKTITITETIPSRVVTKHARMRIGARGFQVEAIDSVMTYGRIMRVRDAEIHVIGRKEVARYADWGVDLKDYEGIHVVCSTGGVIVTAYRNHSMRGLRPRRRSHARRRRRPQMTYAEAMDLVRAFTAGTAPAEAQG